MTKEELLEKLKYAVRTVVHRREDFSKNESVETMRAMMNSITDHGKVLTEIQALGKVDYKWVETQYESWFSEELGNHPEIQKIRNLREQV